jgi:hypothetical protein
MACALVPRAGVLGFFARMGAPPSAARGACWSPLAGDALATGVSHARMSCLFALDPDSNSRRAGRVAPSARGKSASFPLAVQAVETSSEAEISPDNPLL